MDRKPSGRWSEDATTGLIIAATFTVGMACLSIGLYMVAPWIALVVIGGIAVIAGFAMLAGI